MWILYSRTESEDLCSNYYNNLCGTEAQAKEAIFFKFFWVKQKYMSSKSWHKHKAQMLTQNKTFVRVISKASNEGRAGPWHLFINCSLIQAILWKWTFVSQKERKIYLKPNTVISGKCKYYSRGCWSKITELHSYIHVQAQYNEVLGISGFNLQRTPDMTKSVFCPVPWHFITWGFHSICAFYSWIQIVMQVYFILVLPKFAVFALCKNLNTVGV